MSKETVLVCYDPSLRGSMWFEQTLESLVKPVCQTSILLVTEDPPLVLEERWTSRAIMRYGADGHRYLRGICQPRPWMPSRYAGASPRDRVQMQASALQLALRSAQDKNYSLRTFIAPGRDSMHLGFVLDSMRAELPGEVNVLREDYYCCWLDTETTGLSAKKNAVIEIAATLTDAAVKIEYGRFDGRCKIPDWCDVEPIALSINQYGKHPRWNECTTHKEMMESFHRWLPKRIRLAGHNVSFDQGFIEASFRRYGFEMPEVGPFVLDTQRMSNQILKKRGLVASNRLETIAKYFELPTLDLHGARRDIDTTLEVYRQLRRLLKDEDEVEIKQAAAG